VWTGRVEWGADDPRQIADVLRSTSQSEEVRSAEQAAAEWLEDYLTIYRVVESGQAKKDAKRAGHAERTLHRARTAIGVSVTSAGFPRQSWWAKPGMSPDDVSKWLAARQSGQTDGETHRYGITGSSGTTESRSDPVVPRANVPPRDGPTDDTTDGGTGGLFDWDPLEGS
jgi:hypothetical protein